MVCYHPIDAILPAVPDSENKKRLIFSTPTYNSGLLFDDTPIVRSSSDYSDIKGFKIKIPCGQCIGCRLDYSRQWAVRACHEVNTYGADNNMFITLTYNDEHLPDNKSLDYSDVQKFLKRLRHYTGDGLRYMVCGEYGEKFQRPHYHLLLFNYVFPDIDWNKPYLIDTNKGQMYYRSEILEKELWTDPYQPDNKKGFSVIGKVTFESAAYVARYVTKKLKTKDEEKLKEHYGLRVPEFLRMSRDPGLGNQFVKNYYEDILNHGYVTFGRKYKAPVPRYYLNVIKNEISEDLYNSYKVDKMHELYNNLFVENVDETEARLLVREELKKHQCDRLLRSYEFDPCLHNIY